MDDTKKHRSTRWPYVRKQAWDRDRKKHSPCHICGEPIDYTLPASSAPLAWEPDHIRPWSKFPELELDLQNIAPAHTRCNRQRGNGRNDGNVGRHSRIW